jgi:hopene-associated glycosyltransferase HpnB
MEIAWGVAAASFVAWIWLLLLRGGYWRIRPSLESVERSTPTQRTDWPSIVAIIPARNEASVLGGVLPTVLQQDYLGLFRVVLVDDRSDDATGHSAQAAAERVGRRDRLTVVAGRPLPSGWVGKVWAMAQGLAEGGTPAVDYVWFTDADIAHEPGSLRALVDKAEGENLDLVSLMARLRVDGGWDRLLIPAFVYFFAKLYPFRVVSNPRRRTAGAAGGCMLLRRASLERAGGLEAIRDALIDDCALARLIKRSGGRIWSGSRIRLKASVSTGPCAARGTWLPVLPTRSCGACPYSSWPQSSG